MKNYRSMKQYEIFFLKYFTERVWKWMTTSSRVSLSSCLKKKSCNFNYNGPRDPLGLGTTQEN